MFTNFIGWHLELTRRCTLACPACVRTEEFDLITNPKAILDKTLIKNFFKDKELEYMLFCGNLGDPIYHPNFHEISEYFFDVKKLLCVTTNGAQRIDFWKRVLETWPEAGLVRLSIDGLHDTNHLYRVNSKWEKIQELFDLISTTKRKTKIEWKFIVFDHNKHQIDEAAALSKKLGINSFNIQKSYVDNSAIRKSRTFEDVLAPFCHTGDMHYIDAEGFYSPCCWWPNFKKEQWAGFNIKDFTMDNLHERFVDFSKEYLENGYHSAPVTCKNFCRKVKQATDLSTPATQVTRVIINND